MFGRGVGAAARSGERLVSRDLGWYWSACVVCLVRTTDLLTVAYTVSIGEISAVMLTGV